MLQRKRLCRHSKMKNSRKYALYCMRVFNIFLFLVIIIICFKCCGELITKRVSEVLLLLFY
jgi:ACR3 family arsenite efflux pump ArsB